MVKVFKLRKGLDIHLKGKAEKTTVKIEPGDEIALSPASFPGITPKVVVHEGDRIKAGDTLFVNKQYPNICFSSPVSGEVISVVRGDRRKVLRVSVKPDKIQEYKDFGIKDVKNLSSDDVINALTEAGLDHSRCKT